MGRLKNIFTSSFYKESVNHTELNHMIDNLVLGAGRNKSNVGGFQSEDIKDDQFIKRTAEILHPYLKEYFTLINLDWKNCILDNYWYNENKTDHYNLPHAHPKVDFSMVYYREVPKNSGFITFHRDNSLMNYINMFEHAKHSDFYTEWNEEVETGDLIIFPAFMMHSVKPNKSNETRKSMAFNVRIAHG